jgi:membrane protein
LGGLSLPELIRRTIRESWGDAVFGQGGRMAFYQFLAIFPALLVLRVAADHIGTMGPQVRAALVDTSQQILPSEVAQLIREVAHEFQQQNVSGIHLLPAMAGAIWAACNGTWAMIYGLNTAYELEERRAWWQLGFTIVSLTAALSALGILAAIITFVGVDLRLNHSMPFPLHLVEWLVLIALLLFSFAVLYRFAPNLRDHRWRWSTPGAITAVILWIAATVGARLYFQFVDNYHRAYGHLNGVVMLLLWLYVSNAAILIGGEMNSEIEKQGGREGRREQRSGT